MAKPKAAVQNRLGCCCCEKRTIQSEQRQLKHTFAQMRIILQASQPMYGYERESECVQEYVTRFFLCMCVYVASWLVKENIDFFTVCTHFVKH